MGQIANQILMEMLLKIRNRYAEKGERKKGAAPENQWKPKDSPSGGKKK